jgi:hypothetical protein
LESISAHPERLVATTLSNEQLLETMIVAEPGILSDEWVLIGRQEVTGFGGRVDLLAIAIQHFVYLAGPGASVKVVLKSPYGNSREVVSPGGEPYIIAVWHVLTINIRRPSAFVIA